MTKKEYKEGQSPHETPIGAFHELLHNFYELLHNECKFHIPRLPPENEFIQAPPPFVVRFHPALGPLFKIISQKIHHGHIAKRSEWQMDIAEAWIEHLDLDGSLRICARNAMGHTNDEGCLQYSHEGGKCILRNVKVQNRGINHEAPNIYWKNQMERFESLMIHLEGNAEFEAQDVTFVGNFELVVPTNHKMTAKMQDGKVVFDLIKISAPTWYWEYSFNENNEVKLTRKEPK